MHTREKMYINKKNKKNKKRKEKKKTFDTITPIVYTKID